VLPLNTTTDSSLPTGVQTGLSLPTGTGNSTSGDIVTTTSAGDTGTQTASQTATATEVTTSGIADAIGQINGTTQATSTGALTTPTLSVQFGNGTAGTDDTIPTATTVTSSTSSGWLPTALVIASTSPSTSSALVTATDPAPSATSTVAPSTPKIITPADGIPDTPANSTLVRIGFLEPLNYPFVVQHSVTVAQIFEVLPIANSYALQIPTSDVTVQSLQPYSTSQYTATVALLWIPSDQVDSLQVQILATNSLLYSQTDPTAQQLVVLIDPTIPLLADTTSSSAGGSSAGTPNQDGTTDLSNTGPNGGSLDSLQPSDTSSTSTPTGKQAAIGAGAAAAAIAYAALMFLGARRFRQQTAQAQVDRRHSRVSSITGERAASPPFAHSYRSSGASSSRVVRGQNISAPLMTENSLLL